MLTGSTRLPLKAVPTFPFKPLSSKKRILINNRPKGMRRQIMKVPGMSPGPDGEFHHAVSLAKAKTFHY
jgi:hypothetical protein